MKDKKKQSIIAEFELTPKEWGHAKKMLEVYESRCPPEQLEQLPPHANTHRFNLKAQQQLAAELASLVRFILPKRIIEAIENLSNEDYPPVVVIRNGPTDGPKTITPEVITARTHYTKDANHRLLISELVLFPDIIARGIAGLLNSVAGREVYDRVTRRFSTEVAFHKDGYAYTVLGCLAGDPELETRFRPYAPSPGNFGKGEVTLRDGDIVVFDDQRIEHSVRLKGGVFAILNEFLKSRSSEYDSADNARWIRTYEINRGITLG